MMRGNGTRIGAVLGLLGTMGIALLILVEFAAVGCAPIATGPTSLNLFRKDEVGEDYLLSFGFMDYRRQPHNVTFRVAKADHEAAVQQFGADLEELRRRSNVRACEALEARAAGFHTGRHVRFECEPIEGGVRTTWWGTPDEVVAEFGEGIEEALADAFVATVPEVGLVLEDDTLGVDHTTVVAWNEPYLADATRALAETATGYDAQDALGLYLAFVQEIPYEIPPIEWDGRTIIGLWVPAEVVVNNHGDCDSKADLFCVLYKAVPRSKMIVIEVPGHALVGVRTPPQPGQRTVTVGNDEYVLCEVAGPAKLAPGQTSPIEGHFAYTVIE